MNIITRQANPDAGTHSALRAIIKALAGKNFYTEK